MQFLGIPFYLLILSSILIIFLLIYCFTHKPVSQIQKMFALVLLCVFIICIGVILQDICSKIFNVNPIYFEVFIYLGTCFLPVAIFFTAQAFINTRIHFSKKYLLLFVIPIVTLLVIFTNDSHHFFYEHYSSNLSEMVYGWYLNVHILYTYGLFILSIIAMLRYAIKNSGFFLSNLC